MAKKQPSVKPAGIVEDSLRKPGPLSLFGIDKLLHVPLILPKAFHDYSNPVVDFSEIQPGAQVCIAGMPHGCAPLETKPADEPSDPENSAALVAVESEDEPAASSQMPDHYAFCLLDAKKSNPISVHVSVETKAERLLFDHASGGHPLYLYGDLSLLPDGSLVIVQPEMIDNQERGRICARYPSKSRTELVPETKPRSKKQPAKATPRKRKTRKRILYALTVASLVQERLRLGIPACAAYLRQRLYLTEGPSEWRLMKTLGAADISIEGTLWQAHQPRSLTDGYAAMKALERLSAVESLMLVHKDRENRLDPASKIRIKKGVYPDLKKQLLRTSGISMTAEQDAGAREILYDLASSYVMHRALSGSTGSGKTVVFGIVAATLASMGYLVVILSPTSSVAHQTFKNLSSYWPHLPFQFILGDSVVTELIGTGVIIGTTAIWSRMKTADIRPNLIVVDEQHKLGIVQRNPFEGMSINSIEATATPIPRTQGLIEFSGLDVTELRGCHVKKTIHTRLIEGEEAIASTHRKIVKWVRDKGMNLAAIYPLVSDDDNDDETVRSVEDASTYWESLFPGRVVTIHGRMSEAEKQDAIETFAKGAADVIVGTIILEVGIDFPRLDLMLVHNPERLGVATVHQLRGRLARRGGVGRCYLMCPDPIDGERRRLFVTMETENDGFELAKLDMIRRGLGDMRRQSRQQSGNYAGFLVDRPSSIEDICFANDNCQEWIGMPSTALDLFDQKVIKTSFLDAPLRSRETPISPASAPIGPADPCFQLSLLPD